MARTRNIKPGLFKNEILGVADPLYTLLFEGLWTLADREGRLENRPLRIKAEIFPYRDNIDMHSMLSWLETNGFIRQYSVDNFSCIQILKFKEHQHLHKNEPASELPEESRACDDSKKIGTTPDKIGTSPEKISSARPIIYNHNLESLIFNPSSDGDTEPEKSATYSDVFEEAWHAYPKRAGMNKKTSYKAWNARLKSGVDPCIIVAGVKRYAKFCDATGKLGTEYVKQPATFFGPDGHYESDWAIPAKPPKRHGNFADQDYHAGVAEDGSF